jgi:uncharacterized protein YjbJ (UPF0337 family)
MKLCSWNRGQPVPVVASGEEMFGARKMDKQRMEGGLKKATGTIKEKAGQMTGDRDLEAEGKTDKAEGKVRSAAGHVKDAAKEIVGKR